MGQELRRTPREVATMATGKRARRKRVGTRIYKDGKRDPYGALASVDTRDVLVNLLRARPPTASQTLVLPR